MGWLIVVIVFITSENSTLSIDNETLTLNSTDGNDTTTMSESWETEPIGLNLTTVSSGGEPRTINTTETPAFSNTTYNETDWLTNDTFTGEGDNETTTFSLPESEDVTAHAGKTNTESLTTDVS